MPGHPEAPKVVKTSNRCLKSLVYKFAEVRVYSVSYDADQNFDARELKECALQLIKELPSAIYNLA